MECCKGGSDCWCYNMTSYQMTRLKQYIARVEDGMEEDEEE